MNAFLPPAEILKRCPSTAPDLWTVQCELESGHEGHVHRNNQVTWRDHPLIDTTQNTDHWIDGQVVLTTEAAR